MYRRPSLFISVLICIALLFVLSALFAFFIKIAFLALIIAAAYYLYARAANMFRRDDRPPYRRHNR